MISMKTFYLIAGVLMLVVVGFNLWNLIASWNNWILPARLSFIFSGIFFNVLLCILFFGLYKSTPSMTFNNEKEINDIFDRLSKGGDEVGSVQQEEQEGIRG